jgi:hypothetical protein
MALFIFLKGVMLTLSPKMTVFSGVRAACLDIKIALPKD